MPVGQPSCVSFAGTRKGHEMTPRSACAVRKGKREEGKKKKRRKGRRKKERNEKGIRNIEYVKRHLVKDGLVPIYPWSMDDRTLSTFES